LLYGNRVMMNSVDNQARGNDNAYIPASRSEGS
jgi:hypothetical protein